jgi:transcription initiation factor IIE alpha subunit
MEASKSITCPHCGEVIDQTTNTNTTLDLFTKIGKDEEQLKSNNPANQVVEKLLSLK